MDASKFIIVMSIIGVFYVLGEKIIKLIDSYLKKEYKEDKEIDKWYKNY